MLKCFCGALLLLFLFFTAAYHCFIYIYTDESTRTNQSFSASHWLNRAVVTL